MAAKPHSNGHANPMADLFRDSFKLVAETRRQAEAISDTARKAVRAFYKNPADLAVFIERHGTPVYVLDGGWKTNFALFMLGFEPGFIPPPQQADNHRHKRLLKYLGWTSKHKPGCHFTHGLFVVPKPLFTVGYMSHQLHHWMACKAGLGGYNDSAQALYKKFWQENGGVVGQEVYDMSYEEILALKNAINRDLEALQFLRDIASEVLIPNKQAAQLTSGHSAQA